MSGGGGGVRLCMHAGGFRGALGPPQQPQIESHDPQLASSSLKKPKATAATCAVVISLLWRLDCIFSCLLLAGYASCQDAGPRLVLQDMRGCMSAASPPLASSAVPVGYSGSDASLIMPLRLRTLPSMAALAILAQHA